MNRASVVAVSCQVRLTRGAAAGAGERRGQGGRSRRGVDAEDAGLDDTVIDGIPEPYPTTFSATTRYRYAVVALDVVSVKAPGAVGVRLAQRLVQRADGGPRGAVGRALDDEPGLGDGVVVPGQPDVLTVACRCR